jgi:hypothetical protein
VGKADTAEDDRGSGGKLLVSLEPAFRNCLADGLLDLALGGYPNRLEEFAKLPLKTSSLMIASLHRAYA